MEKQPEFDITSVTVESPEQLRTMLEAYGISTRAWDTPPHKDVNCLFREIEDGESRIVHLGTALGRLVAVVKVDIRAAIARRQYKLVEDRQQFPRGGQIHARNRGFHYVSEKIRGKETPEEAARRGIKEELSVDYKGSLVQRDNHPVLEQRSSFSYSGLTTLYQLYHYTAYLGPNEYNPEGYSEQQPDKTTFFVWQELPNQ